MIRPFDYGGLPIGWRVVPIRAILERSREKGRPELPLLSVNLPRGVEPRFVGDGRPAPAEDLSSYQVVRPGQLVMNQLGKPHGAVGVSDHLGIISPAYFVAKIAPIAVPRFLHHLLRTRLYISEYERRGKYMPPSQFDLSWDQLRQIPVTLPPIEKQKRIADFLDIETARIDALITAKEQMIGLTNARVWSTASHLFAPFPERVPLRRLMSSIVDGPFGSSLMSEHYRPSGIRVVRLTNIGLAAFRSQNEAFIDESRSEELARHQVTPGMLLIAGLGDGRNHVGRAAVAPAGMGPAIVKADCYAATVDPTRASARFLAWFLSSPQGRDAVAVAARGTTRSRINLEIAKDVLVPAPPVQHQEQVVKDLDRMRARTDSLSTALLRQIDLLRARRQALITAAVTGELET